MERSKIIGLFVTLFSAYLITVAKGGEDIIDTPSQLLNVFYTSLLSETPTNELPELFAEPTTFAACLKLPDTSGSTDVKEATAMVWKYLRDNKSLFLFNGIAPDMTMKKARLSYCFMSFPNEATFFDGILCAELVAPLSPGGKEGVYKQIRFPLQKNSKPNGPRYFILETLVTLNGVLLDPAKERDRSGDFYRQLGFGVRP